MKGWRLGLDLGTNSIGWAAVDLNFVDQGGDPEPTGIRELGVRIFSDGREPAGFDSKSGLPKIGESCAVARRMARGLRRNRDRRNQRIRSFAQKLSAIGLVPQAPAKSGRPGAAVLDCELNPYEARARSVQEKVTGQILARALFHVCKRRGFLSNRKTDTEDKEATDRKVAMKGLERILQERGLTLGQYLYQRLQAGEHVRFRGSEFDLQEKDVPIYPTRKMYLDEFKTIRRMQGNALLNDEQWDELLGIMAFQRPLLPQKIGVCTFEHGEDGRERHVRASRHLPIFHQFRIVQEVNNLRYQTDQGEVTLSPEQRRTICDALEKQQTLAFSKMRTLLKLDKLTRFNLEDDNRKKMIGNSTACDMRKLFALHDCDWDALSPQKQNDIVECMLQAQDEDSVFAVNTEQGWRLPDSLLRALGKKHLSSSHGHLSRCCMEKLLPLMREGRMYWEAACEVYGDHTDYSRFATGEVLEQLPYYGEVLRGITSPIRQSSSTPKEEERYGRIPNPTVHVALNQLRKLVNALVERFGPPYDIHLELARELKKTGKQHAEYLKEVNKNTVANERRKKMIREVRPHTESNGKQFFRAIPGLMTEKGMRKVHITVDGKRKG